MPEPVLSTGTGAESRARASCDARATIAAAFQANRPQLAHAIQNQITRGVSLSLILAALDDLFGQTGPVTLNLPDNPDASLLITGNAARTFAEWAADQLETP